MTSVAYKIVHMPLNYLFSNTKLDTTRRPKRVILTTRYTHQTLSPPPIIEFYEYVAEIMYFNFKNEEVFQYKLNSSDI